jgi:5'-methylthioadenosine phosphorylase
MGGTGIYDPDLMTEKKEVKLHTPFGATSDLVTVGVYEGVNIVAIPRHDRYHRLNPSAINYRANIWAMKDLGVTHILAPSAVGSLKDGMKPGDIVFVDQIIDRTHGRKSTFYEGAQVCHISVAEPFCNSLRSMLVQRAKALKIRHHAKGTCVVIEGPRFSTRAESNLYREWNTDIINMTMSPEFALAREAEICYQSIAMVTDYDCWKTHAVDAAIVAKTMKENVEEVKRILTDAIPRIAHGTPDDCGCRHALEGAFL